VKQISIIGLDLAKNTFQAQDEKIYREVETIGGERLDDGKFGRMGVWAPPIGEY